MEKISRRLAPPSGRRGQGLAGILMIVAILTMLFTALTAWIQQGTKLSVMDRKATIAFDLAETGVDRAVWALKSSTSSWAAALAGQAIPGYNFDQVYTDAARGAYRISITSGPSLNQVQIIAEGRDKLGREKRSIQVQYTNMAIPAALISGGGIAESGTAIVHWGPMLAMNDINLTGTAATTYFPRKLSKQVVVGTGGNPRDVNGLLEPNTDGVEWWSNYAVPEMPVFDFAALRSSAAASHTLNCNDTSVPGSGHTANISCGSTCTSCEVTNMYNGAKYDDNAVWYWDHDVTLSGNNGIRGTVIVRGNLTISGGDYYVPPALHVPSAAWKEYQKIDTGASNEYPGDNGLNKNAATYVIGSCGMACEGSASGGDVGFYGFVYVDGTINMSGDSDVYGSVWVQSGWSGSGNVIIFYNDTLVLPQLNVTLTRDSWKERAPMPGNW